MIFNDLYRKKGTSCCPVFGQVNFEKQKVNPLKIHHLHPYLQDTAQSFLPPQPKTYPGCRFDGGDRNKKDKFIGAGQRSVFC